MNAITTHHPITRKKTPPMPAVESTAVVVLAAVTMAMSALGTALLPDCTHIATTTSELAKEVTEAASTVSVSVNVLDNAKLLSICLAGAVGGGLMSVLIFPLPTARAMAGKFLASSLAAILFAPMTAQWLGWLRSDALLAVSAGVALVAWAFVQATLPIAVGITARFTAWKLGSYVPSDRRPAPRRRQPREESDGDA